MVRMTYICYHHKIIPENYFALTADGRLLYNGRCVDAPRSPHVELVECPSSGSSTWELQRQGPTWGSLRLRHATDEWCIAQVRPSVRVDSSCLLIFGFKKNNDIFD